MIVIIQFKNIIDYTKLLKNRFDLRSLVSIGFLLLIVLTEWFDKEGKINMFCSKIAQFSVGK